MPTDSLTILHLSDLHFNAYPKNWEQWFSKRLLGAANWWLNRSSKYPSQRYLQLIEVVRQMGWDHLVISGDLTQLALPEEFAKARMALQPLLQDQERVSVVPGNHDYYVSETKESDYFFGYFGSFFGKNEIHTRQLNQDWHLIGWHSATPTPWYSASGCVRRQTLKATDEYLQQQSADTRFVLVNHYPISFPDREHDTKHELLNLEQVQYWLSNRPQIRLYLHGHIHHNWHHVQQYASHSLHVVNSASSTMIDEKSTSSFHRIRLRKDQIQVEPISF